MNKSLVSSLYSRLRCVPGSPHPSTSPPSRLSFLRTSLGRFAAAFIIMAGVTYYFFSPVFKGYTLSQVASDRNLVYPWAYEKTSATEVTETDQAERFYPWQILIHRAFESGDFPLWEPYSYTGRPFFTNGWNMLLYPPRAFLSYASTPTKAHDLLLASHMLIGGLTMFLLLSGTRLSFGASLFGGVAWMLNSFMLSWMSWEIFMAIHAWLPLALLLMRRAVKRGPGAVGIWLGVIMALIFLGGQLGLVEWAFAALVSYGAYLLFRECRRANKSSSGFGLKKAIRCVLALSIPALVTIGLMAIQFIPTWNAVHAMDRSEYAYSELLNLRYRLPGLLFFFAPPGKECPYYPYIFLGTPTAILALVGLWRKHSLVAYSRVLGLAVLLLATGTPLLWVFCKLIPGFAQMEPTSLLFLFDFAAAVLAAFGLDFLLRLRPRIPRIVSSRSWRVGWRACMTTIVIGVVIVQMYGIASQTNRYEIDRGDSLFPSTPLIDALGNHDVTRILPIDPAFVSSTPTIFKLQSAGGSDSVVPDRIGRLWRAVMDSAPNEVFARSTGGPITQFSVNSAFDILPRVGVTDLVVPPLTSTVGGKWNIPDRKALEAAGLSGGSLVPFVGDWNGGGIETAALCDLTSNTFNLWAAIRGSAPVCFRFGSAGLGWIPITGDWNGDGIDTIGMYDPVASIFHLRNSNSAGTDDITFKYGGPGKGFVPVAGDWDGDGVDTVGLYDPKQSAFSLKNRLETDSNNEIKFQFGAPDQGLIPVAGDWDGDKIDSIGLYNPKAGAFYLKNLNKAGAPDVEIPYGLGNRDLKPVSGYWDKEIMTGRLDVVGLFDPASAEFYLSVPAFIGHMKMDRVYAGPDGDIYKVKNPVPRAYIVHAAEVVDSPKEALVRFSDLSFDPRQAVIVESDQLKNAGIGVTAESKAAITKSTLAARTSIPETRGSISQTPSMAEIVNRTLNSMTVRVDSPDDGWLVIAESWDAGWTASLDGGPSPMLPGNYAFRTIRIPSGPHVIELVFRPVGFVLGSTITGATMIALLIAAVVSLFKRAKSRIPRRE